MKRVIVYLAKGFEEVEALKEVDRGGFGSTGEN